MTAARVLAGVFYVLAVLVAAASADIVALKDGAVLECRILKKRTEIVHGETRTVLEVETAPGKRRTLFESEIAWIQRARVSWEARAEAMQWYSIRRFHVAPDWKSHFRFAKECRRKKLYEQAYHHFKQAYEFRRRETPDTVEGHARLAEWLLNDCELYGEAVEEFRIVYAFRRKEAGTAADHMALGDWCEKRLLYDEAEQEYRAALGIQPGLAAAQKALKDLQKLRLASFHPRFYRELREPFRKAVEWLRGRQNRDGSFGGDLRTAGVQAHRGVTALAGIALLNGWELLRVEGSRPVPREVKRILEWFLSQPPNMKRLRGPDVWGNVFGLEFLVKCYTLRDLRSFRSRIREKVKEIYEALAAIQGADGGWMYYDFARNSSAAFVTSAMIVNMLAAKREGIGPSEQMIERAISHLKRVKLGEANYTYRTGQRLPLEGNTYRSPICELAMFLTGNGNEESLRLAIDNFFKYRHIVKKIKGRRGTHIGQGRTAPYYYLYGHYWMSRAIKALDRKVQAAYLERLKNAILPDQEPDGTFWDWPMFRYHKTCGTALGAMCLFQIMSMSSDRFATTGPPMRGPGGPGKERRGEY